MKKNKILTVEFRRKRKDKTDYKKRLILLKSGKARLVVRKSKDNMLAQLVKYLPQGDNVVVSASSIELKKYGWNYSKSNLPSSYLVGLLVGKKAISKGIKEAILDIGLTASIKGSRVYAVLKGAIDAGLKISHSPEILPDEKRIRGEHIKTYAEKIKGTDAYKKQFSGYLKGNIKPEEIDKVFANAKNNIMKEAK